MNIIKKYLKKFDNLYEKYLLFPFIIIGVLFIFYYTIKFDIKEMVLWGIILGVNLFNLYLKNKKK
tara:strand:+ start:98 stop:292 length:195 start_codon:yes stop_codon:yes gene_type:complete